MQDKYEKALKDAKARELMYAEEAAILEKVCISLLAHRDTQAHNMCSHLHKHAYKNTHTHTHASTYTHRDKHMCVPLCFNSQLYFSCLNLKLNRTMGIVSLFEK